MDGPLGQEEESAHRRKIVGGRSPILSPLSNGMSYRSDLGSYALDSGGICTRHHGVYNHHHPPPKMDFPQFDGENPKDWQLKCENYFRIYSVQPEIMISIATMYFTGGALLWLQSSKAHHRIDDWETFAEAVVVGLVNKNSNTW